MSWAFARIGVQRSSLALVPDVVVLEAEQRYATAHGAENLIQMSALAGVEPRTLASSGRGCCH